MTEDDVMLAIETGAYPVYNTVRFPPPAVGTTAIMWLEEPDREEGKRTKPYFFEYLRTHTFPCGEKAQVWLIVGGEEYIAHPRYLPVQSNLDFDPNATFIDVFPVTADTIFDRLHEEPDTQRAYWHACKRGERRPYSKWLAAKADEWVMARDYPRERDDDPFEFVDLSELVFK